MFSFLFLFLLATSGSSSSSSSAAAASTGLSCCDSTGSFRPQLPNGAPDAVECYETMRKTKPETPDQRSKGGRGQPCDFCTVQVFFAGVDPNLRDNNTYYLQSCGSKSVADFEKSETLSSKRMKRLADFGDDLTTTTTTTKPRAFCRLDVGSSGYELDVRTATAGVVKDGSVKGGVPAVDLTKVPSVKCACLENDCNGLEDVVPKMDEIHKNLPNWIFQKF